METISTQSIFQSSTAVKSWRSYAGSAVVHGVLVLLALSITIPAIRPIRKAAHSITLIAPVPEYKAKRLPQIRMPAPSPIAPAVPKAPAPPKLHALSTEPAPPKRIIMADAPKISALPETPQPSVQIKPQVEPEPPAPLKPAVQTGVFQTANPANIASRSTQVAVGGFGDPNGVAPSANSNPGVVLPKLGSFDAPGGAANGASSHAGAGTVQASGFNNSGLNNSRTAQSNRPDDTSANTGTPVEILFKPRPVYTPEARNLRLEGQVSLEVVFQSTGSIRIVRVVQGLGHGLDEAAEQAALQVRFKPAMRGGVPVDTNATIRITFELT